MLLEVSALPRLLFCVSSIFNGCLSSSRLSVSMSAITVILTRPYPMIKGNMVFALVCCFGAFLMSQFVVLHIMSIFAQAVVISED